MKIPTGVGLQAALYIGAGVLHFARPQVYLGIMPAWVPWPEAAVSGSGIAEIALGTALLFDRTRRMAAFGIILLLIAVFPANIEMAKDWRTENGSGEWLAIFRLPLQAMLIWWAWKVPKR